MKVSDFPENVGRLTRKSAVMKGDEITAVVYELNRRIMSSKKYYPIRNFLFKVEILGEDGFRTLVNDQPAGEAGSLEEVQSRLINAFDRECIRAGIVSASPHTQAPPDMAPFKNPRH